MTDMKYIVQIAEPIHWFQKPNWEDLRFDETRINMHIWDSNWGAGKEGSPCNYRGVVRFITKKEATDFIQKEEAIGDKYYPMRSYKIRKESNENQ